MRKELMGKNILNPDKLLINDILIRSLSEEKKLDTEIDIDLDRKMQNDTGIYVVCVRVLNNTEKNLVYSYIYYPKIFMESFLTFLMCRGIDSVKVRDWGDSFIVLHKDIFNMVSKSDVIKSSLDLNSYTQCVDRWSNSFYIKNQESYIKCLTYFINTLSFIASDWNDILTIFNYSIRKDYKNYCNFILKDWADDQLFNFKFTEIVNDDSVNLTNTCLFVVQDIKKFIKIFSKKGYDINQGPKRWRAQVDSMKGLLISMDYDYRNALYNHYETHKDCSSRFSPELKKSNFSFNNIHMNLGNVRWYSTSNINIIKEEKVNTSWNTGSNFMDHAFAKVRMYINDKDLHNEDKQKNLEMFLNNQHKVVEPYSILNVDWDKFNKKLIDRLFEFKKEFPLSYTKILTHKQTLVKEHNVNDVNYLACDIYSKISGEDIYDFTVWKYLELGSSGYISKLRDVKNDMTYMSISLAKGIYNIYLNHIYNEDVNKKELNFLEWKNAYKNNLGYELDDTFYLHLASPILEIFIRNNLLEMRTRNIGGSTSHKITTLNIPKDLMSYKESTLTYTLPIKLPMIVPPKPYHELSYGGYLLNGIEVDNKLIIEKKSYKNPSIINKDSEQSLYDAANHLINIPYKINRTVFDFIIKKGNTKDNLLTDINLINKYDDLEEKNRKLTHYQRKELFSLTSKINLERTIMILADIYKDQSSIYFPIRLDQRGRIYCEASYLSYQGTDLAKSLLLFSNPGLISRKDTDAIDFLKAYGANCFGLNKKSLSYRIKWIDNHKDRIIDYQNSGIINEAKDKFLFLAFCAEYVRWENYYHSGEISPFKCYLPIQLDGTCNGFQHLALMSTETNLLKALNLSSSSRDSDPEDFYNYVEKHLKDIFLLKSADKKSTDVNSYNRLKRFHFNRSNIKKAVMTLPYNARNPSTFNYIKETLYFVDPKHYPDYVLNEPIPKTKKGKKPQKIQWWTNIENNYDNLVSDTDIWVWVKELRNVIENQSIKIGNLKQYFISISRLCFSLSIPITWSLPSGLTIHQSYLEEKTTRIKPFKTLKHKLSLTRTLDTFDKKKQTLALMPNVIHSLDAYSLTRLVTTFIKLSPNTNIYAIHDCYGVSPDKVVELISILKSIYISIYIQEQYIKKFDQCIIDAIMNTYGNEIQYDEKNRTITYKEVDYKLYPLDWVLGYKELSNKELSNIKESFYLIT